MTHIGVKFKVKQRLGVVTADHSLCILEIWSSALSHQPKFADKWQNFQFIIAKNVTYHGTTKLPEISDSEIFVFRLGQKDADIHRFIWLSAEFSGDLPKDQLFWDNPIAEIDPEFALNQKRHEVYYSDEKNFLSSVQPVCKTLYFP